MQSCARLRFLKCGVLSAQAALAADETAAATGGADDVMKLEVRDEGAEPAEAAAVDEAAAAVRTPAGQVCCVPCGKHTIDDDRMHTPVVTFEQKFVASAKVQDSISIQCSHASRLHVKTASYCVRKGRKRGQLLILTQAPSRARLASPSNEGSLSYTVGDLKQRLRALKLPLHGRKAELLERLKAALAADTAASGAPSEDAVAAEGKPQPAPAATEEQTHAGASKAKRRKPAVVRKPRQAAAAARPDELTAGDEPAKAAAGRRKRVQPGTAALGPIATAKVTPLWTPRFVLYSDRAGVWPNS